MSISRSTKGTGARFHRNVAICIVLVGLGQWLSCMARLPATDHHLHSGVVVRSIPPGSDSYQRYLTIRLALDRNQGQTEWKELRASVDTLLLRFPRDPKVWTLSAEVAWKEGDKLSMRESLEQALKLVPEFPPALRLREKLQPAANHAKKSL